MKKPLALALLMLGLSVAIIDPLRAEDTDIYVDNASNSGVPNVLFVIDNGANFEASGGSSPCVAYDAVAGGGAPSLGNSNGGIQQCALVNAIANLPAGAVNIGILVGNANNFAKGYSGMSSNDAAFYQTCDQSTGYGGCVIRPLTFMNAAAKTNLINFIKSWKTSGSDSATGFNVKAGGNKTANMMQEAWAYYSGKVGMSGRSYPTSFLNTGCQKNFIIFIANAAGTSSTPADTPSGADAEAALGAAQVGATAAQKLKISKTIPFSPATCGVTSLAAGSQASNWSSNWADEWSRLMFQKDGGAADASGAQNIISYGIGLIGSNCKPDYPALLTSLAENGGGKYYSAGGADDLTKAIGAILNEVQAVNSVFSSASLPVSVNAQGTYLNQIFLGMFRPDPTGGPRWLGNLKQYKFVYSGTSLVLGDATGAAAISSGGTGFISPNAVSFWSTKTAADDAGSGYFVNDPKGTPATPFNSPDGEIVEKGGTAQQIRLESLNANFAATAGTSTNPRRLYTYCPGATCNPALTHASNKFAIENTEIAANAFGASSTVPITSIVRTGTTAVVTTSGNHGFASGTTVTISNAGQNDYNGNKVISSASGNSFTISGLNDFPTTPAQGAYQISAVGGVSIGISSLTRSTSPSGTANAETVFVVTNGAHGYNTGSTVQISGVTPSAYNVSATITVGSGQSIPAPTGGTCLPASCFTYSVPIYPTAPAVNTYRAVVSPSSKNISSITDTGNGGVATVNANAHGLHQGQAFIINGTGENKYDGITTFTVASVINVNSFTFTGYGGNPGNVGAIGSVSPSTTGVTVTLTRTGTTDAVTVTASGATANAFGTSIGDTKVLNITRTAGTSANEAAYEVNNKTITCTTVGCTSFTYSVATTPLSGSINVTGATAAPPSAASDTVAAGSITRSGEVATISGLTGNRFGNFTGATRQVNIATSGAAFDNESAYVGTWTITCANATCTSATFGNVTLSPLTPATGTNMQAFSVSTPPDRDTLIRWVRGEDNYGDEKGPSGSTPIPSPITVRPSVHGDVLHSRPVVINYGDSRGLVVFYGANDGVFRAVNGSQTEALGSVPAGGELWGLVLKDHYGSLNRQRQNSPELKFPSTTLASAELKNYFVDGPAGAYQKLNANGTIAQAILYLTMRRGGRFIYALDVTTPTAPVVMWKIDSGSSGFGELGQTWSRPRVTVVPAVPDPVIVFGAGYDVGQDEGIPAQAPRAATMGRGIFVVNAITGAPIWSANSTCSSSATCKNVPGMVYPIPSEIAFVDRDNNGKTDRLYFGDLGGNLWRVNVNDANTANWTVTKLAALGCDTGVCAANVSPRKFFFPPAVLSVGATAAAGAFDMVLLGSGDREHPLQTSLANSVVNRFFMVKDTDTTVDSTGTSGVVMTQSGTNLGLVDATASVSEDTTTNYTWNTDSGRQGFYITFASGEKAVNAPLVVNGTVYFGTNKPMAPTQTCTANLGEARGYAVNPFTGVKSSNVYPGGGLPPSAVTGLVTVTKNGKPVLEKFCIGCINAPGDPPCNSALENCTNNKAVIPDPRRTYWYKK